MRKAQKEDFWRSHVEAMQRSGASASAYAQEHAISDKSLSYWRRKLREADSADTQHTRAADFIALRVPTVTPSACILVLATGLRLEMPAMPAPQWLAAVARELR